ncbi:MAG: amidohydrolase family protein [Clostridia bacterium]|nr:amidohydrolase family protein [Clostridia bacterium]
MKRKIIDSHWHLYTHTDRDGSDFREVLDKFCEENALAAINICSIPIYKDLGPAQNMLAAIYKLHNRSAYAYAGLVYPEKPFEAPMPSGMDPLSQYNELMEIGFDGIKMLETKPYEQKDYSVFIDDEYFDSFFAACEENNTHMIWHVADPETFWDIDRIPKRFLDKGWYYGDGSYLPLERVYDIVYNILEKHPRLSVNFAHFFFMSDHPEKLEELFEKYPNVGVDITPGAEMYGSFGKRREFYRDFFIKYADRIMYGSDISYSGAGLEHLRHRGRSVQDFLTTSNAVTVIDNETKGISLPKEALDKIYYQNFEKVAGNAPKPINKEALVRYVEKYRHLINDQKMLDYILKTL